MQQSEGMPNQTPASDAAKAFGATFGPNGAVQFRFWAPRAGKVRVAIHSEERRGDAVLLEMSSVSEGFHELTVPQIKPGTRYEYVLEDGIRVPDPASRYQPDDVHGPSEVIDSGSYDWRCTAWQGRPWHEAVVYEIHIGAFTSAGTFSAAIEHLDYLRDLGITAIEIMPVADFPGARNWGYDGAFLYAPDAAYGRPETFKALIDAAHERGLMVFLDVVYNHFGPDGNFLPTYAPAFFTDRHKTPWGAAINYDGPHSRPVREFIIQNALYWVNEFKLDGLRLDAVHAILDDSSLHLLDELAERLRASCARTIHLILENEENEAELLARSEQGRARRFTAQWNDDVHHVLHVAATGESQGYYADYLGNTEKLARALAEGFAFQGETMQFSGKARGQPSDDLPPSAFVAFIQNHDQIGNRAFGERLTTVACEQAARAVAAVYLLLPQIPMLFMGEEWGARQPFPFFCDFQGDLADAVRQGRRQEFAKFPEFQDEATRERIPDPQAVATFASAKLQWDDRNKGSHADSLEFYRKLLAIRRQWVIPLLDRMEAHAGSYTVIGDGAVLVQWHCGGSHLILALNLSTRQIGGFSEAALAGGQTLWQEGTADRDVASAWFVRWSLAADAS